MATAVRSHSGPVSRRWFATRVAANYDACNDKRNTLMLPSLRMPPRLTGFTLIEVA